MRISGKAATGALCAAALTTALAACSSNASGSASSSGSPTASASVSIGTSGSPTATATASASGTVSGTLTSGHCTLYTKSQATALIGSPNVTTGLPEVTTHGGTRVDTCMYGNVDVASRTGTLLAYGAVKYSSNSLAAAAVHTALQSAEAHASGPARKFPAPGTPSGTRDGVWTSTTVTGMPSITVAGVVTNDGPYLLWATGGGTVKQQRAEQIATTVENTLVSHAGK